MSVVSHGHEEHVARLLEDLAGAAGAEVGHVILTHNLPAQPVAMPAAGWRFRFTEVFNQQPAGFGRNHNRAFALNVSPFFCVLNPDVRLADPSVLASLLEALAAPGTGCAYPRLRNADGSVQYNARELVTPWALVRRYLLRRSPAGTDWASGAFWLVRSEAWQALQGLDERFFMYGEDVDFCLRLQLAGWRLAAAAPVAVHDADMASRRGGRALAWHVRSLWRLWHSAPYRQFKGARARLQAAQLPRQ